MVIFDFITSFGATIRSEGANMVPVFKGGIDGVPFTVDFESQGIEISSWLGNFGVISTLVCVLTVALAFGLWHYCKKIPRRFRDVSLQWGFAIVWALGFIVYDIGTCTGAGISLITNAPMAALHSLGMFILDSDVSAIHHEYHASWIYMAFFSLVHLLAAIVSSLFLIKHFGYNISARFKMWRTSLVSKKWEETFVFWGLNEATHRLANNINERYGNDKTRYRIVVVRTNKGGDDTPEKRTGINRVFRFLSLRNSELEKLQKLCCLSTDTYADFSTTNPVDTPKDSVDIIGQTLGLKSLRRVLAKKTSGKIHMLFLSDNESENLHDAALLLGDKTIKEFSNKTISSDSASAKSKAVIFYCHARYNSVHRVVEDLNSTDMITVKVIDSSHINVEMIKQNEKILPVNFVDVQSDATVSSPFNALVVGFSEVGQDSVRFLYEFGAFVKSGSTDDKVERSEFHLHVVDKQMSNLAGTFVANSPAIKPSLPFIAGKENEDALITLHEMDCRSVEFYNKLEGGIKHLNYVVIATDDDELNISLGVRIFKMAARYRSDMDKLCILVRAHNDDDGHIRNIANHYNRLWAAQKAAGSYTELNQFTFKRDGVAELPIYLFGLDKEVYTYDNVIDDALEQNAIKYKEAYEQSTEAKSETETDGEKGKRETVWMREFKKLMQRGLIEVEKTIEKGSKKEKIKVSVDSTPYTPTYGGLMKLRRAQGQDFANCLHQSTKAILSKRALEKLGLPKNQFDWTELVRKKNTTTYTLDSGEILNLSIIRVLNVLAQTEHLRWNASHELLGYRHAEECVCQCAEKCTTDSKNVCATKCDKECRCNLEYKDEVRLIHNCIRSWENLSEEKRSYDYNIVDITLNIINPDNPIKE